MPLLTNGFDPLELADHFKRHGHNFGVKTAAEYELLADHFLGGVKSSTTLEHIRQQGDLIRYDYATEEFGILSNKRAIRTYIKPDPKIHGMTNNADYYRYECKRVFI